jgi:hypothetical protein
VPRTLAELFEGEMGHWPPTQHEIAESLPLGPRPDPRRRNVELRSRATTVVVGTIVEDVELAIAPSPQASQITTGSSFFPRLEEHPTVTIKSFHFGKLSPLVEPRGF